MSRAQLAALGVDDDRIYRLGAHGWLARVHTGVYRVGSLTPDGVLWAALLAAGSGSTLSHGAAGHEHVVLRTRRTQIIDVTAPARRRPRAGLRLHRARLDPRDVTTRRGLRFTTISRTLLDLAADLREPELQAAVDEARVQRRLHRPSVEATIARAPGTTGSARCVEPSPATTAVAAYRSETSSGAQSAFCATTTSRRTCATTS